MKILISPAKSIDTSISTAVPFVTECTFLKEANYLMGKLSKLSTKKLMEMMHISIDIAEMNVARNQQYESPVKQTEVIKPAVTVFTGEVYRGLDAANFSEEDFEFAQKNLRILSGLYGLLKPLDLMYPYRLEMGTKWEITPRTKNLYHYWGDKLKNALEKELEKDEPIVNLASTEYFKAMQANQLSHRIITPHFKDFKNGDYKIIMMYAKNARGQMANFIIKNKLQDVEELKSFNVGEYRYDENLSTENDWVFTR